MKEDPHPLSKRNKIIIIFYAVLGISYFLIIIYLQNSFAPTEKFTFSGVLEHEFINEIVVDKKTIFNSITDVQKYPIILPQYIISVKILNQTENILYAEDEIAIGPQKIKVLVRHTFIPYSEHMIEVLDGDAKGSIIKQKFKENGPKTEITTEVKSHLNGIFNVFRIIPVVLLEKRYSDVLLEFLEYSQLSNDPTRKAIDKMYREILLRPADEEGLTYWGSLVETGRMTLDDVRKALMESEERKHLLSLK